MWLKLKDNEGARGLTRRALFDFFFSEFESYELKMSSRMIFLQMMRDPRTPFEEQGTQILIAVDKLAISLNDSELWFTLIFMTFNNMKLVSVMTDQFLE